MSCRIRSPSVLLLVLLAAVLPAAETAGEARRTEQMLASILRSAPSGVGVVENRVIISVNDYIVRLVGYRADELIGQNARMLYPSAAEYEYVGREKYRQIARYGTGSVETVWKRKDGGIVNVILSSTPLDPQDLTAGVVFTVLDITERRQAAEALATRTRWFLIALAVLALVQMALILFLIQSLARRKRAEAALRLSEEHLSATLHSIGDAVIATDTAGRVTRLNPVAERLTGWPIGLACGRPLTEVFRIVNAQTRCPADNPVQRVLATGEVVGLANRNLLLGRDGGEYQIAESAATIRDAGGTVIGVVLVFRDVTGEYAMQQQVQQSQKMDAIGKLAGGIAHDFNNMLGGIVGSAELLRSRLAGNDAAERYVSVILQAAERAGGLTAKLLAFARRQPVNTATVDVHQAVRDTIAILSATIDRRISITADLAAPSAQVMGDLALLQSVFLNLGINAVHAMPGGGVLTFRSQVVDSDEVRRRSDGHELAAGDHLEIEVADTGCGITPENLPRIFEPFFTTKPPGQGTGLGLSAALGTIQQHHGAIGIHSVVGSGTSFRVLLPLIRQPVATAAPPEPPARGSGLILLVDDEEVMRTAAAAMLEELGYRVLTAVDGQDAIALFQEHRREIDLVLLDMIMPKLNGRDCFHALRAIRPDLPIVLSSGFASDEDLRDLQEHGLMGSICKPFRGAELARVIGAALRRKGSG